MQYSIDVTFTRELSDDAEVIGKSPDKCTDDDLIQQFRKELQALYDDGAAGSFVIRSLNRKKSR